MSISFPRVRLSALALWLCSSVSAHADAPPSAAWGLGVAVGQERQPYRDIEHNAQALPLLMYENRWVRVLGPTADLKLISNPGPEAALQSAGLRLRLADEGYESTDSPHLAGMAERKASLWLGGSARWRVAAVTLTGEVLADASGHSEGARASLGMERPFRAGGRVEITPRLVVHWLDRRLVDYHYGVRPGEALATRPAYRGDAATNVEAGVRIGYAVAPRQRLSFDLGTTRLGTGIRRSPLVEASRQDSVRVSFLHLF